MEVQIKDREEDIEYLRMALNMCELYVDYTQTDLIIRISEKLKELKGNYTILDGIKIHNEWKKKWLKYFEINQ